MNTKKIIKTILRPLKPIIVRTHFYQRYTYTASMKWQKERGINKKIARRFVYHKVIKISQYEELFRKINISIRTDSRFQHWIDENLYFFNKNQVNDSLPPDYSLILKNSIADLLEENKDAKNEVQNNNKLLLQFIEKYIEKIVNNLLSYNSDNTNKTAKYFERMLTTTTDSLEEAFQRILFWTSLFWQTKHCHVGLGRLDKILEPYIKNLSDNEIIELIKDFYSELHNYYAFKSLSLMGDTGQLIIIGGKESDGSYFCNRLTYCFIKAMKQSKLPDPKLLLRVSDNMPQDLLALAIECNATGIGCPLLSNDERVIPALEDFGYSHDDACNYVTSACWEPFCYGNALGRSNLATINYAKILESLYKQDSFIDYKDFRILVSGYCDLLKEYMDYVLSAIDKIRWEKNPLMSLFMKDCIKSGKDVSEGGVVHNDYGILCVGLANTVDSLLNIKHFVFDSQDVSLSELRDAALSDFSNNEALRKKLSNSAYFAHEDDEVLSLLRQITTVVENVCSEYQNYLGGKVKFGLSSPVYIEEGEKTGATLDGRNAYKPLSVHISAKLGEPYTELINFAGKLNYNGLHCNGNVVDFFISPAFIQDNFDKFCYFLKAGIQVGFYQMQMNVVSSETLIAAKKNPELYPNLIVRVWGFSAYFKDLPEQYKNIIIQRALESEKAV